jgi:hypothetical protein
MHSARPTKTVTERAPRVDNDPTFICDSNSGRELAAGVDMGSGFIEINWFNYN